jgi:hypothetical protein
MTDSVDSGVSPARAGAIPHKFFLIGSMPYILEWLVIVFVTWLLLPRVVAVLYRRGRRPELRPQGCVSWVLANDAPVFL